MLAALCDDDPHVWAGGRQPAPFFPLFAYFILAAHSAINTWVIAVFTYWTWMSRRPVSQRGAPGFNLSLFLWQEVSLCFGQFLLFWHSGLCPERAAMEDFWGDIAVHRVARVMSLVCICKVCGYIDTIMHRWHFVHQIHEIFEEMRVKQEKSSKLKPDVQRKTQTLCSQICCSISQLFHDLLMDQSCLSKNQELQVTHQKIFSWLAL